MRYFLLIYDRVKGCLVEEPVAFQNSREGLKARFAREAAEADRPELEVTLLGAPTLQDLTKSHSRFFVSPEEMQQQLKVHEGVAVRSGISVTSPKLG